MKKKKERTNERNNEDASDKKEIRNKHVVNNKLTRLVSTNQ